MSNIEQRLKEIEERVAKRLHDNHVLCYKDRAFLLDIAKRYREALEAHLYYWPRRRAYGCAQAITTARCGHLANVGAPCCRKCAIERINNAIAYTPEEPK